MNYTTLEIKIPIKPKVSDLLTLYKINYISLEKMKDCSCYGCSLFRETTIQLNNKILGWLEDSGIRKQDVEDFLNGTIGGRKENLSIEKQLRFN